MKHIIIYFILSIAFAACSGYKKTNTVKPEEKPVRIANDELKYELIVFDNGFNRFLNSIAQPRGFISLNQLETRNKILASNYNARVNNVNQFGDIYGPRIEYQSHIHYGYEVNYLLYNYFLFFQNKYNQKL